MFTMRAILVAVALTAATASVVEDTKIDKIIGKDTLDNLDVKLKELCIVKLLNHILQPTVYQDIREVAREYVVEENMDKYLKVEVVKDFITTFKLGMLPRGEVFVHNNKQHMEQAVKVFRLMYFAKDFDAFIRTACFLRERINGLMFAYALKVAVFHRSDCMGIAVPAPYEVYPFLFVDSNVIYKVGMMKMMKTNTDPNLMDYYGIKVFNDQNMVVIDARKGVRHVLSTNDRLAYFTEDMDLNTYIYNMYLNYPYWMTEEDYGMTKERYGEILSYVALQLLARLRLERLSHEMCDIKMLSLDKPLKAGYWPKLRLHTGDEMPVRYNNIIMNNEENVEDNRFINDIEGLIRNGILTGQIGNLEGTTVSLKKPEDVEFLSRYLVSNFESNKIHIFALYHYFLRLNTYNKYNLNKYSYVPTATDMIQTCFRDSFSWKASKRIFHNVIFFKNMLPKYTRDELSFPGVKIEGVTTDKLVTFMDNYDMDVTNAVYLNDVEMKNMKSDMVYVVRQRRMNHHPFKVSVDVVSDKAVDAVVRVFLGPKYDCMGRLMSVNDKRLDMVEIDSFIYKLETGKNTIIRNSVEMHGIVEDRPWTRYLWDRDMKTVIGSRMTESYWYKTRTGFPHRLMLPMGRLGGLPLQLFVIVTPVRTGLIHPSIDISAMKQRHMCPFSSCIDTMPLGFPFDREVDTTQFFTTNMKFHDVMVYRKDMDTTNVSKGVDTSDLVMKRDDLTYLDNDMLVKRSYKDVMMSSVDNMNRM